LRLGAAGTPLPVCVAGPFGPVQLRYYVTTPLGKGLITSFHKNVAA
jgi:hypothetical protein